MTENKSDKRSVAPGWITVKEAASLTGYDPEHIRNLARQGRIRATKVWREWLVDEHSALEYRARMDDLGKTKHSPWRPDLATQGRGRKRAPAGADTSPTSVGESEEREG